MTKTALLVAFAATIFSVQGAFAETQVQCREQGKDRALSINHVGNKVIVEINNISNEVLRGHLSSYDHIEALKADRKNYLNGALERSLVTSNSTVTKDGVLHVEFDAKDCSFSKTDTRVLRCMPLNDKSLSVLTETDVSTSVSAFGETVKTKSIVTEISVPVHGEFSNLILDRFNIDSDISGGWAVMFRDCEKLK